VVLDLTALRRAREALRAAAAETALAEARERRKLAADLHDDVGQILSLASLKIEPWRTATPRSRTCCSAAWRTWSPAPGTAWGR
jgi:signal transduction histidine kinase